jgi:hypothetical protein
MMRDQGWYFVEGRFAGDKQNLQFRPHRFAPENEYSTKENYIMVIL